MKRTFSRRKLVQGAAAAPALAGLAPQAAHAAGKPWPILEGPDTPKLCLGYPIGATDGGDEVSMRRIKEIGVDYVLGGGGRIPWTEDDLRARMQRFEKGGLKLWNLMIGGFNKTIYGKPGRDEEIENVIKSIRAAGKVGLPVVEYNFYAHRIVEGYYGEPGRGGAGYTSFDYEKVRDLPPLPEIGAWKLDQIWANITYFLKAVIPEAEKAGVKMALHPNDPPAPISRGSEQIMGTLAGWKKLISIVDSPANGITYDCGVTRELGEDPVEVCRYFASRKRINHVHFRNVVVKKPYELYAEVFPDNGQAPMFAVMKELVRNKYNGSIYPEHPRQLDADRELEKRKPYYPGGGGYAGIIYNVAYARAMLQAALDS